MSAVGVAARHLCGEHIGAEALVPRLVWEDDGWKTKHEWRVVVMITHKKNGEVVVRYATKGSTNNATFDSDHIVQVRAEAGLDL